MIVIDASVLVEWLLDREDIAKHVAANGAETVECPEFVDLETLNTFRRFERSGSVSAEALSRAVELLQIAPVVRYSHQYLAPSIWQLRHNATAYDASYLALTDALNADELWTFDRGQARIGRQFLGENRIRLFERQSP